MKIKPEHYKIMKDAMAARAHEIPDIRQFVIEEGKAKKYRDASQVGFKIAMLQRSMGL